MSMARCCSCLLVVGMSLSPVFAADAQPAPAMAVEAVDFPTAVSRALANNPSVKAASHDVTAAKRDADATRAGYLPSLTFEEKFVRTNVPAEAFGTRINEERLKSSDFADVDNFNNPPPINDFIATLSLEQPLFAPRVAIGSKMASAEADAKGLDLSRRKEDTVYRVLSAYLNVLTAREYVKVAAQALSDAREHLRVAEATERSGMGLASDVLRAKVLVAQAEGGAAAAANRFSLARKALALAMGGKGGSDVDAAAPLPPFPEIATVEERIALALASRSDLKAFSVRVGNAGTNVLLQRSDYLPTAGIMGAYQVDAQDGPFSADNRTWKVGVGLRWNIFDGLRREAAVGRARAFRERADENYREARDHAAFQVSQAYLFVQEADLRVGIAKAAADAAEEALRLVKSRYGNELARMVDLVDAQAAANASRADLVRAENDVRQARADLEYAGGTLLSWALPGGSGGKGSER